MSLINSREYKLAIHLREFHWEEISGLECAAVDLLVHAASAGETAVPFWVAARVREADAAIGCVNHEHI